MGKVKTEIQELFDTCEKLYQIGGATAVIDYIEEAMRQGDDIAISNVVYERCEACDNDMPSVNHVCLVCGQETKLHKQILVDAVIEDLKKGFELGDYTVLDELLNMLSIKKLVQALPEEEWNRFKDLNNSYFEIVYQDFNEDAGREEIRIRAGENGNVYLFQDNDKLGFIVDAFGENDLVDTMTIWEEDMNPDDDINPDDEESNIWGEIRNDFEDDGIVHIDAFTTDDDNEEGQVIAKVNVRTFEVEYLDNRAKTDRHAQEIIAETLFLRTIESQNFSDSEIAEFKKDWGQYHNEITDNLGYPLAHSESDELLMDDYFWDETEKFWYPKSSSMYTPREQAIADHLRNK